MTVAELLDDGVPALQQWRGGAPTRAGIVQFTQGDCWILAWALHRRGGWPIIGLYEPEDSRSDLHCHCPPEARCEDMNCLCEEGEDCHPCFHTLVQVHEHVYVDVNGPQTWSTLNQEWMSGAIMGSTRQEWLEDARWINREAWSFEHAVRRAGRMADKLIEKYNLLEVYPCP